MEGEEETRDMSRLISKLPRSHAALVKDYRFKFEPGNTLHGDDDHIGYMDKGDQEIAVAAPWNYGREFTLLHEIAHLVWERLDDQTKQKWAQIADRTKDKQHQNPEELFAMAYANYYAKNKVVIHDHPEWKRFIANLPK